MLYELLEPVGAANGADAGKCGVRRRDGIGRGKPGFLRGASLESLVCAWAGRAIGIKAKESIARQTGFINVVGNRGNRRVVHAF